MMNGKSITVEICKYVALCACVSVMVLGLGWTLKEAGVYRNNKVNGKKTELAKAQIKTLSEAIECYKQKNGRYPPENDHKLAVYLVDDVEAGLIVKKGQYIDPWGGTYLYHLSAKLGLGSYPDTDANPQPFYLWSYGPNREDTDWGKNSKQPANRDNITNWPCE